MHVLVVDAFATEPMAGRPIAVFPGGGGTDDQYRAVASELGAVGTLVAEPEPRTLDHEGAVAAAVACGALDTATETEAVTVTDGPDLPLARNPDGTVPVELPSVAHRELDRDTDGVADVLGVDPASLADVGADLPMVRVRAGRSALAVPVNFMEHLGRADPDYGALAGLLSDVEVDLLYLFTFDTVAAEADFEARVFTPAGERAADARASAATGVYLSRTGTVEPEDGQLTADSGGFIDRPSRVQVGVGDGQRPVVSGPTVTVFDGTAVLPEPDDDGIIEV